MRSVLKKANARNKDGENSTYKIDVYSWNKYKRESREWTHECAVCAGDDGGQ